MEGVECLRCQGSKDVIASKGSSEMRNMVATFSVQNFMSNPLQTRVPRNACFRDCKRQRILFDSRLPQRTSACTTSSYIKRVAVLHAMSSGPLGNRTSRLETIKISSRSHDSHCCADPIYLEKRPGVFENQDPRIEPNMFGAINATWWVDS